MKICAIDDDLLMLRQLEAMLGGLGFEVVTAGTVDAAIALMRAQHCDAAVVDILMPERDGLNFIMEIRKTRPDLRIVAISGGGRLGAGPVLRMAAGLGADATLMKPFSASELGLALTPGPAGRTQP
jgi:DNA-binding response OmpR family regulator